MLLTEIRQVSITKKITPPPALSADLWGDEPESIDEGLMKLQAKHFVAWLRKQVRLYGRKADLCDQRHTPVEIWAADLGYNICFIAGGEVEVNDVSGKRIEFTTSDWVNIGYYMYEEDGMMVTQAGKMLDVALLETSDAHLVSR